MVDSVQGEVIRFDQAKGYGFISPAIGGEDVFLHANDLLDEKYLVRPGAVVEFVIEAGERGPKASSVHVVTPAPNPASAPGTQPSPPAQPSAALPSAAAPPSSTAGPASPDGQPAGDLDDELVDVLSAEDFSREVTEALLRVEPGLTGPQILAARQAFSVLGTKYGWIGS